MRGSVGLVGLQLRCVGVLDAWGCSRGAFKVAGGAPRADDAAASDLVDLPGPSTARVPLRALCADVYCSPAGETYFQLHLAAPARRRVVVRCVVRCACRACACCGYVHRTSRPRLDDRPACGRCPFVQSLIDATRRPGD